MKQHGVATFFCAATAASFARRAMIDWLALDLISC
jgi:hypothetical protein